jgi:TonB-dependent Receptor Plug Domain
MSVVCKHGARHLPWLLSAIAVGAHAEDVARYIHADESLESLFAELNQHGFQISYSSNVVLPAMHVLSVPRASDLESLLREVLAPWGLSAIKAGENDYLIVPSTSHAPEISSTQTAGSVPASIETVNVTATRYGIATEDPQSTTLSAHDVQRIPHLFDDAMRVLKSLPGVAGRDLSARVNVRGGRPDELMMLIDGAEIHNGFHFQEGEDGVLSLVDTNLVRSMEFTTGGMTAQYGDYMSGVVDIQTRQPTENANDNNAVGISFISSFARTGGTFDAGRGYWIASARRSYLDLLLSKVQGDQERLTPEYQDAFTAVQYQLSDRTSITAHALLGSDKLVDVNGDTRSRAAGNTDKRSREVGNGGSSHVWLNLDHDWSDTLKSSTVLSWATGDRQRDNFEDRPGGMMGNLALRENLGYLDLRQDWSWLASNDSLFQWGLTASRDDASYDYRLQSVAIDPLDGARVVAHDTELALDAVETKYGVYAAYKTRLGQALSVETGARWDHYQYDIGGAYSRVSPRLNAVYELGKRSELRAAWGITHQPQSVDDLDVTDGERQFQAPESARHIILGYALQLFDTMNFRVDVYQKDYSDLRPRYENELFRSRLIAEAEADRIRIDADRARAQGVEVTLRRDTREQWGGWLTYGYMKAADFLDDRWRPRSWEQQHTLSLGIGRSGAKWDAHLAAFYHNGLPATPIDFVPSQSPGGNAELRLEPGLSNSGRLGHYLRVDLRASREVFFENSTLTYYIEVFNLLDRDNPYALDDFDANQTSLGGSLDEKFNYGFPRLPSFGFNFEF